MGERLARIRRIERAGADALTCREVRRDDGWRLRYHDGITRRCNAVFAEARGGDGLAAKIARAEAFYRAREAVPRFQLSEASRPASLPAALRARGYRSEVGAWVETAPLDLWGDPGAGPPGRPGGRGVTLEATPGPGWLEALARATDPPGGVARLRRAPLAWVRAPAAFATLSSGGEPVTVGLAVLRGEELGLFHLATVPAARRRGYAADVIAALLLWGLEGGARTAFLQVHPVNVGARALYRRLGFRPHHVYTYWEPSHRPWRAPTDDPGAA